MLHEHRVLTSSQIAQLAFDGARTTNARLRDLYRWRIVDRFQPHRPCGSAPMHYVLDTAGAAVLCHHTGLDRARLGYRHEQALAIAHSLRLAHTVGVNGVFTSLVADARSQPGCALTAWWSEARCARLYGDLVRPDGYARWHEGSREVEFFLEYDTGTEPLTRVAAKLDGYHRLAAETGIITPVVFWFPTADRETHARDVLGAALRTLERPQSVPVATTHHTAGQTAQTVKTAAATPRGSAEAHWAPLNASDTPSRRRLTALLDVWPHVRLPPTPTPVTGVRVGTAGEGQLGTETEPGPPSPMPPDPAASPNPAPDS